MPTLEVTRSSRLGSRGLAFGTLPHAEADTIIERTLEI